MNTPNNQTDRERLIVLEYEVAHISREMEKVSKQVGDIHSLFLQAKGAKWFIIAIASIIGFFIGIASSLHLFAK